MERLTLKSERDWSALCGVTRIARVTGLDRTGIEVACAVRPRGHVLQVCQGKGETRERARLSALMEAAELWAAERVDPIELIHATEAELVRRAGRDAVWREGSGLRIAWRRGRDLVSRRDVYVPAAAVHCLPAGAPELGGSAIAWTSNGMGAHPSRSAALRHALLEAVERDQLARVMPRGWTSRLVKERRVGWTALPRTALAAKALGERGFDVHLFDLTPEPGSPGHVGFPVAGAILIDTARGALLATAGYACRGGADEACLAALHEAAQSRLTDIHGARDDVHPEERAISEALARRCASSHPVPRRWPRGAASPATLVRAIVAAGLGPVVSVDLAPPGCGLFVVKTLGRGLRLSELLA